MAGTRTVATTYLGTREKWFMMTPHDDQHADRSSFSVTGGTPRVCSIPRLPFGDRTILSEKMVEHMQTTLGSLARPRARPWDSEASLLRSALRHVDCGEGVHLQTPEISIGPLHKSDAASYASHVVAVPACLITELVIQSAVGAAYRVHSSGRLGSREASRHHYSDGGSSPGAGLVAPALSCDASVAHPVLPGPFAQQLRNLSACPAQQLELCQVPAPQHSCA